MCSERWQRCTIVPMHSVGLLETALLYSFQEESSSGPQEELNDARMSLYCQFIRSLMASLLPLSNRPLSWWGRGQEVWQTNNMFVVSSALCLPVRASSCTRPSVHHYKSYVDEPHNILASHLSFLCSLECLSKNTLIRGFRILQNILERM